MEPIAPKIKSAQVVVPTHDLEADLRFFVDQLGFRINSIFPADSPTTAVISGHGVIFRLEPSKAQVPVLRLLCDLASLPENTAPRLTSPSGMKVEFVAANPPIVVPKGTQEFVLNKAGNSGDWSSGRAGMQYRDLIPSRLGGRFVASHIRIPQGGAVPDYVHYHRVRFQMIFCKAGWVRVVYEDQGPAFVLNAGDCVLQPPEIRHQVLEASPGLEVIEIGCPAIHETFADHELALPNTRSAAERRWNGQVFVRHVAESAQWKASSLSGFEARDTGIAAATNALAGVQVLRANGDQSTVQIKHEGEFLFLFVLRGELGLQNEPYGTHTLVEDESCVLPAGERFAITARPGLEILQVVLPAAAV